MGTPGHPDASPRSTVWSARCAITFSCCFLLAGAVACGSSEDPTTPPPNTIPDADAATAETSQGDTSLESSKESSVPEASEAQSKDTVSPQDTGGDSPPSEDVVDSTVPPADAPTEAASGPPASELPFEYSRPDVGTPVSTTELQELTDLYLELLDKTRYFENLHDRSIGWPEGDPQGRYWYGTWWSGCGITKKDGKVTFLHVNVGADNNGLRTAQVMEAACYSYLLWGKPLHGRLLNKTIRGFNSWILALQRKPNDTPVLLSRAAYPESITAQDYGKEYTIDYSTNRPGLDNPATDYVNVPNNPHWGDLWVKNKRSKDDLGHMFRAIGQMQSCAARLTGDASEQLTTLRDSYSAWSRQVESDGWAIATLDKNAQVYIPTDDLAHFYAVGGIECPGQLMLRLLGQGDPGTFSCGNGISNLESLAYFNADVIKTSNKEMAHTYHEGAANQALVAGQDSVALSLVQGLGERLDRTMNYIANNNKMPDNVPEGNFVVLLFHAANVGVPLTSREVRWLHDRIRAAHDSYLEPSKLPEYDVWGVLPDGEYALQPEGNGIRFNDIGLALGSCSSIYRNPTSRPLLDCDRILANPR